METKLTEAFATADASAQPRKKDFANTLHGILDRLQTRSKEKVDEFYKGFDEFCESSRKSRGVGFDDFPAGDENKKPHSFLKEWFDKINTNALNKTYESAFGERNKTVDNFFSFLKNPSSSDLELENSGLPE